MKTHNRAGFALPVALGAIVVIGTLVTGVFFVATQENQVGRNTASQEKAFRAAEASLNYAYGTWQNVTMNNLSNGGTYVRIYDSTSKGWVDTVRITRLNKSTYWLSSTAYAGPTQFAARHRTGMVIRIAYPAMNFLGALTVRGPITFGGSSYINGADVTPDGWTECPPAGAAQPGVATTSRGNVTLNGCTRLSCIDGSPDIRTTSAAGDTSTYFNYGPDANWATLTAAADIVYSGDQSLNQIQPALLNGACDQTNQRNWGDNRRMTPAGPCESYFPIIYFSGVTASVHITTGSGQGILLVDGDLIVDGGFEWYGPVIVRGHVTTQGTGGHFNGAVMAADVNLEQNTVLGDAIINYSSCAINEALVGSGVASRIPQRAWAYIF